MEQISVLGLGKVGVTLAACLCSAGYRVIGTDVNIEVVESINKRKLDASEPHLLELIQESPSFSLVATCDTEKAVLESDISFVVVPTPSNSQGGFSLCYVKQVCERIATALQKKDAYHVIAIVSTLLPGSSEGIIIPYIEKISGRKAGKDFGYCYNPAFIALGEIVKGFLEPEYILIGEFDQEAGNRVQAAHSAMARNHPSIARMSPIEAEIVKLASNAHDTMRVSFANMLFSLCTELPGANVDKVTIALSHRLGRHFFKGATPYGGPCWPRDNLALSVFMDAIGVSSIVPKTIHRFNNEHARYVFEKILGLTDKGDRVGLLGLAYKTGTPVVEESFGVKLANWLVAEGRRVFAWDPLAIPEAKNVLGNTIDYAESGDDCIKGAGVVVIVNPLREIDGFDWNKVKGGLVIDCWRCLGPVHKAKLKRYIPLGQGIATDGKSILNKIGREQLRLLTD